MEITRTYDLNLYARAKKIYEAIRKDITPYDIISDDDFVTTYQLDECTIVVGKFSPMPHATVYFNDGRVLFVAFDNSNVDNYYYASIFIERGASV